MCIDFFSDDPIPDKIKKATDEEKYKWLQEKVEEIFKK